MNSWNKAVFRTTLIEFDTRLVRPSFDTWKRRDFSVLDVYRPEKLIDTEGKSCLIVNMIHGKLFATVIA